MYKDYIIKLDDTLTDNQLDYKALWGALFNIKSYATKVEILSVAFPYVLATIKEEDLTMIQLMSGVILIEEDQCGSLVRINKFKELNYEFNMVFNSHIY